MATPAPLPKSPDLMTEAELSTWVQQLVDDQVPESVVLDYKRKTYDLANDDAKLEVAKDISSFANSQGGALLLGIPQVKAANGLSLPAHNYGIARKVDYEDRVRNILASALSPLLPHVRAFWVPKVGDPDKGVYLVWHPESWLSPHMVHGYREFRYFRRDADVSRPVPMAEQDVERLYQLRVSGEQRSLTLIGGMEDILVHDRIVVPQMHICLCPRLLLDDALDFSDGDLQDWLLQHRFGTVEGAADWLPTSTGARQVVERDARRYCAAHLLSSGALLVSQRLAVHTIGDRRAPSFDHIKAVLWETYRYVGSLYSHLGRDYVEFRVRVTLWYVDDLPLCTVPAEHQALGGAAELDGPHVLDGTVLASELVAGPEAAMKPMLDRVWRTFGIDWTVPLALARVPDRWKR